MGNPSWGKGYHQGLEDGYSDGTKDGGIIGVAITLAGLALAKTAHWGYKRLKARRIKKREEASLASDSLNAEDASQNGETKTIE